MNVALTRCRKGMVVVTDRLFLQGAGRSTLLGQLCHTWSQHRNAWIEWKAMLNGSVALPGLSGSPSNTLQVSRVVPAPTSSRTAPVSASTSTPTPQRPPAHTNVNERSHPHATTPRRNPPPQTTRMDETTFPPLPSAARTGTGAPETPRRQQPGRPGTSQIPKYDPISKLGLRYAAAAAAAAPGGNDAVVSHWRQKREAPRTPTLTTFWRTQGPPPSSSSSSSSEANDADAKGGGGFWRSKARADAEAGDDGGSWRRTAGPLIQTPSAAEASGSWRRGHLGPTNKQVSTHAWQRHGR